MVMKPPSGGPASGPTSAGIVRSAMAETSSLRGVPRTSTRRATGVIIAPPMPCRKREKTKATRLLEMAQKMEPAMKTRIAARKIFLAPKRSAIQPLKGMKIASDTI
ncbi:hypothetical protein D9M72_537420 [compost metagenome]